MPALRLLLRLEGRGEHRLVDRDAVLGAQRRDELQDQVVGHHGVELLAEAVERFLVLGEIGRLDLASGAR